MLALRPAFSTSEPMHPQIGEGGYAFVYHARDIESQEEFALKKVRQT